MTLTYELDLDFGGDEPSCRISRSKVISFEKLSYEHTDTQTHTHTHIRSIARPGPLNYLVNMSRQKILLW